MDNAATNGHLQVLIWLHENRSEGCMVHALDAVANIGHWEVAQWLVHNRTEGGTPRAMDDAVAFRHLRIAELLREQYGAEPTQRGVLAAVKNGFMVVLQWLQVSQLGFDPDQCRIVAERSCQFHIVHWIDVFGEETEQLHMQTE